jgi:O-antigen ligase
VCSGIFTRIGFGLESLAWLAVYGMTAYQIISNFQLFAKTAIESWVILVVPAMTLISTYWSASQGHTFAVSIQFIYTTVIAIWMGAAYSPYKIFIGLGIATGIGVALSSINAYVQFISAYSDFDGFFIGIFAQKNVLGRIIVFMSISVFLLGIKFKWPVTSTLLVVVLFLPLSAAESATSLLMYLMVFAMPVIWWIANTGKPTRLMIILGGLGAVLLAIAMLLVVEIDLVDELLGKLGKDSTLTGRTFIWSVAREVHESYPILGVGFDSFWFAGTFDDTRRIYLAYGEGINGFHNTFLEVLVSLGLVGEAAFIITMLVVLYKISTWFIFSRSIESLSALYVVGIVSITSFMEIVGFRNHDINHIMLVTLYVLSLNYHRKRKAAVVPILEPEWRRV